MPLKLDRKTVLALCRMDEHPECPERESFRRDGQVYIVKCGCECHRRAARPELLAALEQHLAEQKGG